MSDETDSSETTPESAPKLTDRPSIGEAMKFYFPDVELGSIAASKGLVDDFRRAAPKIDMTGIVPTDGIRSVFNDVSFKVPHPLHDIGIKAPALGFNLAPFALGFKTAPMDFGFKIAAPANLGFKIAGFDLGLKQSILSAISPVVADLNKSLLRSIAPVIEQTNKSLFAGADDLLALPKRNLTAELTNRAIAQTKVLSALDFDIPNVHAREERQIEILENLVAIATRSMAATETAQEGQRTAERRATRWQWAAAVIGVGSLAATVIFGIIQSL